MVYEIPKEEKILKAFEYAKEKFPKIIRLRDLKRVCDKNLKDWRVPVEQQYVWFCLNGINIRRKEGERIFKPRVVCYPFYIGLDKEISKIISDAANKLGPRKNFAKLTNRCASRVCDWANNKIRIPITALLKACQILNKDPWFILNGKKICGQCRDDDSFIFKNLERNSILDILTWIKLEGTISLSNARIEIEQKDVGSNALLDINNNIKNKFKINTLFYKRKRKHRTGWMYVLRINSSPLKQILYLKYGIDFGYKSPYVDLEAEVKVANTKQEKIKILASAMETEGHFGFSKVQKYLYARCHFTSSNKVTVQNIKRLMNYLGLHPYIYKKDRFCWRVSLERTNDCSRFFNLILPYMNHQKKIAKIIDIKNTLSL